MYHIKEDKRSKKSAQLITEGLLKCLEVKEFSKITITDIQKESSVGRSTFYRLFDNLSDVLSYQCDNIFDNILEDTKKHHAKSTKNLFFFFTESWMKNELLLQTIVSINRLDILYEAYRKRAYDIKDYYLINTNLDDSKIDYLIAIATASMASILSMWIQHGKVETVQELFENLKVISSMFYKTICEIK